MGLFDPPAVGIRKKIPKEHWRDFDTFQGWIQEATRFGVSAKQKSLIEGVVLAAWVINECRQGRMILPSYSLQWISNMGTNCGRFLKHEVYRATDLANDLIPELRQD